MYYGKLPWLCINNVTDIIKLKTDLTTNNILINNILRDINSLEYENTNDYIILLNNINKLSINEYIEWIDQYINLSVN